MMERLLAFLSSSLGISLISAVVGMMLTAFFKQLGEFMRRAGSALVGAVFGLYATLLANIALWRLKRILRNGLILVDPASTYSYSITYYFRNANPTIYSNSSAEMLFQHLTELIHLTELMPCVTHMYLRSFADFIAGCLLRLGRALEELQSPLLPVSQLKEYAIMKDKWNKWVGDFEEHYHWIRTSLPPRIRGDSRIVFFRFL